MRTETITEYVQRIYIPSIWDYQGTPEKLFNDTLSSDIAFAGICSTDTEYPYGCDQYHSAVAANYDTSVSPNIAGFAKYQAENTRIWYEAITRTFTYFDQAAWDSFHHASAEEERVRRTKNQMWDAARALNNIFYKNMELYNSYKPRMQEYLHEELGLTIEESLLDTFLVNDVANCLQGGQPDQNRGVSCFFAFFTLLPPVKGAKGAAIGGKEVMLMGKTAKSADEIAAIIREIGVITKLNSPQATKLATALGYKKVNAHVPGHGKPIYHNPNAPRDRRYISPDGTGHNGGTWKGASDPKNFTADKRTGTYNADLTIRLKD